MLKVYKWWTGLILTSFLLIGSGTVLAWDNKTTHKDISDVAAGQSILNGGYLQDALGIEGGLDAILRWSGGTGGTDKKIRLWIQDGADFEDNCLLIVIINCRFNNHFHNPLQPWAIAGLNDYGLLWNAHGESALFWAQNAGVSDQSNTDWSWQSTRQHYYLGLTSQLNTNREAEFAQTFVGLGHQIHLIQDMSQPSHVRNDGHPEDYIGSFAPFHRPNRFENWASLHQFVVQANIINSQTAVFPMVGFNSSVNGLAPITSLFDTNTYSGIFPISLDATNVGLAEYTNANFFSEDTINSPEPRHQFPFPSVNIQDYSVCADQAPPGSLVTRRWYISRGVCSQQGRIDHFLASSLLTEPQPSLIGRSTLMDSQVYEDYARQLLPRAVGYSAGLLNYFFRGQLDIIPDPITGIGYVIVNNTEEDMDGTFDLYYEDSLGNRTKLWSRTYTLGTKTAGNNKSAPPFAVSSPGNGKYVLVFKGRLGLEEGAVVGRVVQLQPYLVIMKVDHATRQSLGNKFYQQDPNNLNQLVPVTESQLPFGLMDDGAYWDSNTSNWTAKGNLSGLGVPLGVGGPQSIAKYWDSANHQVRFVLNGSYEKEAYQAFHEQFHDPITGQTVKDFYYVTFVGSPLLGFGTYNENTGWMAYSQEGLLVVQPTPTPPQQRFFTLYKGLNFNDVFVETPTIRFYHFDQSIPNLESSIPLDPEAPMPSIISAAKVPGENSLRVSIPNVFNTYTYQTSPTQPTVAGSGFNVYRLNPGFPTPPPESHEDKCSAENNSCGNLFFADQGSSTVKTVYTIPYNDNSSVRVHRNDGGLYYEELYINGQLVKTSPSSTNGLETHYQILAVQQDIAVIRETRYLSYQEIPLPYLTGEDYRINESQYHFEAQYHLYVKGVYDPPGTTQILSGTTQVTTKYFSIPSKVRVGREAGDNYPDYFPLQQVEDITGYHLDRIFIGESSAGSNILIAFDEYTYNNGAGLVHSLHYELSNLNDGNHILYYDIPLANIQNADHEGTRVGRKLLLFGSDGTLQQSLQDPIGLNYTIGSIGILN